jgi:hypothetical protein
MLFVTLSLSKVSTAHASCHPELVEGCRRIMLRQAHASTSSCFDKLSMTTKLRRASTGSCFDKLMLFCHPELVEGLSTDHASTGPCFFVTLSLSKGRRQAHTSTGSCFFVTLSLSKGRRQAHTSTGSCFFVTLSLSKGVDGSCFLSP